MTAEALARRAPPLPEYIAKPYRPRKMPCAVCGAPERATKATGCDWLPDEGAPRREVA